jgi:DNA-binding response OmpR family regulator
MGTQHRILLIEDDDTLSKALADTLSRAGFAVSIETNGESGLVAAKRDRPDLIITDLSLPKLDGVELLRQAREERSLAETPAIVFTNRDDIESLSASLALGHVDFLMKHEQRLESVVRLVRERLKIDAAARAAAPPQ